MNPDEMNLPEEQLRSWRPRRPSGRIERQLFGKPKAASHRSVWLWSSLVPATACAILTLLASNPRSFENTSQTELLSSSLSNYDSAAYASEPVAGVQNHVAGVTFDCTNRGNTYSSVRFAPSTTNFSN